MGDSPKQARRRQARLSLNEMTQAGSRGWMPGAGGRAGRGLREWVQLTVYAGEVRGCKDDGVFLGRCQMTWGRVSGDSLRPSSPMLVSTNQPPPSSQPGLPITWRTKLLDVVSEEVLPSDLLNRPFLLLYLPWRSQEGTKVESETPFPTLIPSGSELQPSLGNIIP